MTRSLTSVPVIVERSMWWPGSSATWHEAHNSPGSTSTGTAWALAEGEVGGVDATQTYILIANASSVVGDVKVTLFFEDGTTADKMFTVAPNSRFSVDMASEFPTALDKRFGALVESFGLVDLPAQLVVERAMYSNANAVVWAAGTNALATRVSLPRVA